MKIHPAILELLYALQVMMSSVITLVATGNLTYDIIGGNVQYCYSCFYLTNCRLHEFDEQVSAVREGMAKVIPVPLLSLFSGYELETMVCGSPDIPLNLLKSVATYKGKGFHILIRFTMK
jgi:hypothetical protein